MAISSSLLFVVGRWSLAVRDSILLTTNDQRPTTALQILRVLRHLFAALQTYVRFLPIRTVARELAPPPFFSRIIRGAHRSHLHLEDRLHRFLDLGLRRLRSHLKYQRVLRLFNAEALFRDHRFPDNLIRGFHQATSAFVLRRRRAGFFFSAAGSASWERRVADFFSESCSFSSAGCANTTWV